MSGVYIRDLEMPKSCLRCYFSKMAANGFVWCTLIERHCSMDDTAVNCPLAPVPDHGRLIDADSLDLSETDLLGNHIVYVVDLDDAPTILPPDKPDSPRLNIELLRSMAPEELAAWLDRELRDGVPTDWLAWLQEEATP